MVQAYMQKMCDVAKKDILAEKKIVEKVRKSRQKENHNICTYIIRLCSQFSPKKKFHAFLVMIVLVFETFKTWLLTIKLNQS